MNCLCQRFGALENPCSVPMSACFVQISRYAVLVAMSVTRNRIKRANDIDQVGKANDTTAALLD